MDPDSGFTVYTTDDSVVMNDPVKLEQLRQQTRAQVEQWEASQPEEVKQRMANRVRSAPQLWLEHGIRLAPDPMTLS